MLSLKNSLGLWQSTAESSLRADLSKSAWQSKNSHSLVESIPLPKSLPQGEGLFECSLPLVPPSLSTRGLGGGFCHCKNLHLALIYGNPLAFYGLPRSLCPLTMTVWCVCHCEPCLHGVAIHKPNCQITLFVVFDFELPRFCNF